MLFLLIAMFTLSTAKSSLNTTFKLKRKKSTSIRFVTFSQAVNKRRTKLVHAKIAYFFQK